MTRAALFAAALVSAGAVAAPVPPASEKELVAKHWGKIEGDGEAELKGRELTLRSTFGRPALDLWVGANANMPRASRTVRGDFEIAVTVTAATPPNLDAKLDHGMPEVRAGLFVAGDEYRVQFCLYQYYQVLNGKLVNPDLTRYVRADAWYPRGGAGSMLKSVETGKSTYLRVVRKDEALTMSYSFDGKEWSEPNNVFRAQKLMFPDEVTVGVFLSHSTYQFAHATFDAFTVEKPAAPVGGKKGRASAFCSR